MHFALISGKPCGKRAKRLIGCNRAVVALSEIVSGDDGSCATMAGFDNDNIINIIRIGIIRKIINRKFRFSGETG